MRDKIRVASAVAGRYRPELPCAARGGGVQSRRSSVEGNVQLTAYYPKAAVGVTGLALTAA